MFLYFLVLDHNKSIFKEEMAQNHPLWRFSYSRHNFITYKTPEEYTFESLKSFNFTFSLLHGLSLGRSDQIQFDLKKDEFIQSEKPYCVNFWDLVKEEGEVSYSDEYKDGGKILDIFKLKDDEYFFGIRHFSKNELLAFSGTSPFTLPSHAPSRAYLKIAEAFSRINPYYLRNEVVLELGAAPGGASLFLLEKGLRVVAVDPGKMDPILAQNTQLIIVNKSVQDIDRKHFLSKVPDPDWIVSDMNINPFKVFEEIKRLIHYCKEKDIKGLFVTVKLTKEMTYLKCRELIDSTRALGHVISCQLPSHHKEFLLYINLLDL